jgi:hypothetical protein
MLDAGFWTSFLLVLGCFTVVFHATEDKQDDLDSNGIPGSRGRFFLDETVLFGLFQNSFVRSRFEKYGPIFRTRIAGRNTVVVVDPKIHAWVKSNDSIFAARLFDMLEPLLEVGSYDNLQLDV